MSKIIRNSARCFYCGQELVSTHRHDFKTHVCESVGKVAKQYDHDLKAYVSAYPSFSVDGGNAYLRRLATGPNDFVDTSIVEDS